MTAGDCPNCGARGAATITAAFSSRFRRRARRSAAVTCTRLRRAADAGVRCLRQQFQQYLAAAELRVGHLLDLKRLVTREGTSGLTRALRAGSITWRCLPPARHTGRLTTPRRGCTSKASMRPGSSWPHPPPARSPEGTAVHVNELVPGPTSPPLAAVARAIAATA